MKCQKVKSKEKTAMKVSLVSIVINLALSLLKLIVGIVAHSSAVISDGVHSASDVFSTIVVMIGIKLSCKKEDREHPYGHERMECVAAIILAIALLFTGIGIGYVGIVKIMQGNDSQLNVPKRFALIVALISIIIKELMFWYTRYYAKRLNSDALMADAWHHRSDALSSVGAFMGIWGARLGYPVLDPLTSVVICVFIVKVAYDIFRQSIYKMVDHSCDEKLEEEICKYVKQQEGVLGIECIRTRIFGNKIYVDIEILADSQKTLMESYQIGEQIKIGIETNFQNVKHSMVYVSPQKK